MNWTVFEAFQSKCRGDIFYQLLHLLFMWFHDCFSWPQSLEWTILEELDWVCIKTAGWIKCFSSLTISKSYSSVCCELIYPFSQCLMSTDQLVLLIKFQFKPFPSVYIALLFSFSFLLISAASDFYRCWNESKFPHCGTNGGFYLVHLTVSWSRSTAASLI